jgi:long-chain fatty acid transport protein
MGSAFTAVADDASTAWYNPAGIAFVEGTRVMAGGDVLLVPGTDYTTNSSTLVDPVAGAPFTPLVPFPTTSLSAADKTFVIPHVYISYNEAGSKLSYSLGINSPFGLETDWPNTAANPFAGKNTFSRLNMVMVNPNVTYKINDNFSIAVGIDYANAYKLDLNNSIQSLTGDGDGWGANVAALYKGDGFNVGVSYRSRIEIALNGTATAQGSLKAFGATSSAATTSVTLPDQVNVGIAYMPNDEWTLSLDVDWVNWTTYDVISIKYGSAAYLARINALRNFLGAAPITQTDLPQNWDATVAFRLGAEWKYAPNMRARFGYVYDPTPINDVDFSPSVPGPENKRQLFSVGYSYDVNNAATIDLAYAYVLMDDRNQTASPVGDVPGAPNTVKNGLYQSQVHIVAASLAYRF